MLWPSAVPEDGRVDKLAQTGEKGTAYPAIRETGHHAYLYKILSLEGGGGICYNVNHCKFKENQVSDGIEICCDYCNLTVFVLPKNFCVVPIQNLGNLKNSMIISICPRKK